MQNKWIRTALIGLGVITAVAAHAAGRITGVSVLKVGNGVEVLIQGSGLDKPKAGFIETATQYSLNFDAQLSLKTGKMPIWQNGLETIQSGVVNGKSNLRFKFTEAVNAVITSDSKSVRVTFEPANLLALFESAASSFIQPTPSKAQKLPKTVPPTPPVVDTPVTYFVRSLTPATKAPRPVSSLTTAKAANRFASLPAIPTRDGYVPAVPVSTAPKVKPAAKSAPASGETRVSLDFVDTQIVNIIKSLALQTRVNIVTSPDVVGKLSVKLEKVTVNEALNLVTSLAGLRYAQVGRTYVVTTEAKFAETIRGVSAPKDTPSMSRVVSLYSGQAMQIKVAVLKSVSSENAFGRFELILPSERTLFSGGAADKKEAAPVPGAAESDHKDMYLMLIGSPGRLDEVESLVRSIDRQLCVALGIKPPKTQDFIVKSYVVHGGRATDLIEAIAGKGKSNIGSVECFATPTGSIAKQTIVLKGLSDEVDQVISAFESLDSDQAATMTEFQIVDLMYTDPRAVREALISNIPGLSVVIAPNAVLNPKVYQEDRLRSQSEQRGTDTPAPQGGGTPLASGNTNGQQAQGQQANQAAVTNDKSDANSGLILPFDSYESVGMPMRLIMKGSRDQVDRGLQLVKQMDTAPKQVSLELRVMEISREELLRLGINWNMFTSGAVKTIRLNNPGSTSNNTVGSSIQGRDVSGDVAATLDSVSNGSRLISRPNMICNDGRSNEVFVGDVIRYIESIISGQNGPSVTQGQVATGVRLAAFPRLGGDGTINLDLRTKVVYLKGWENVPQIGGRLPQTSERTAQNSITLKDGETFAIGGLIQQEDRKNMSGLPILKDLPIFGQFFRSTSTDKVKTELIIFVTAKMVQIGGSKELPMERDAALNSAGEYKLSPAVTMAKPTVKTAKDKKGGN